MSINEYCVTIIVEPDGEGYYAHCPGLPEVFGCGDTKEEALKSAQDGILSVLRTKNRLGDSIKEGAYLKKLETPSQKHEHANKFIVPVVVPV